MSVPENKDELYSLRYAEFVVPLVKAVQEQQVMIEEQQKMNWQLQQEILELKAKLDKLEALLLK